MTAEVHLPERREALPVSGTILRSQKQLIDGRPQYQVTLQMEALRPDVEALFTQMIADRIGAGAGAFGDLDVAHDAPIEATADPLAAPSLETQLQLERKRNLDALREMEALKARATELEGRLLEGRSGFPDGGAPDEALSAEKQAHAETKKRDLESRALLAEAAAKIRSLESDLSTLAGKYAELEADAGKKGGDDGAKLKEKFEAKERAFEEQLAGVRALADQKLAVVHEQLAAAQKSAELKVAEVRAELEREKKAAQTGVAEAKAEAELQAKDAEAKLAEARAETETKLAEARAEAELQVKAAEEKLAEARAEAELQAKAAEEKLAEARAEFEREKKSAEEKLAAALAETELQKKVAADELAAVRTEFEREQISGEEALASVRNDAEQKLQSAGEKLRLADEALRRAAAEKDRLERDAKEVLAQEAAKFDAERKVAAEALASARASAEISEQALRDELAAVKAEAERQLNAERAKWLLEAQALEEKLEEQTAARRATEDKLTEAVAKVGQGEGEAGERRRQLEQKLQGAADRERTLEADLSVAAGRIGAMEAELSELKRQLDGERAGRGGAGEAEKLGLLQKELETARATASEAMKRAEAHAHDQTKLEGARAKIAELEKSLASNLASNRPTLALPTLPPQDALEKPARSGVPIWLAVVIALLALALGWFLHRPA